MAPVAAATATRTSTSTAANNVPSATSSTTLAGSGVTGGTSLHPHHLRRKRGISDAAAISSAAVVAVLVVGTEEPTGTTTTVHGVMGRGRGREEHAAHGRPPAETATRSARLSSASARLSTAAAKAVSVTATAGGAAPHAAGGSARAATSSAWVAHATAAAEAEVLVAAMLSALEHSFLQFLTVHAAELGEAARADSEGEEEGHDLARAELDPGREERAVHHGDRLGHTLFLAGTVAATTVFLRGARKLGSGSGSGSRRRVGIIVGVRFSIGVDIGRRLPVKRNKPVVPLLHVIFHAHQLHVRPNGLGEVIVTVAAEGLLSLNASQELGGGKALLDETAGIQAEKGQGLDEHGRGHGGDAVVLAKVAGGPAVDPLLLFGLIGILGMETRGGGNR